MKNVELQKLVGGVHYRKSSQRALRRLLRICRTRIPHSKSKEV